MMKKMLSVVYISLAMLLNVHAVSAQNDNDNTKRMKVMFHDIDGKPIPKEALKRFHCRDMADEPLVVDIEMEDGLATFELPDQPVQLSMQLKVAGFGEVMVYADGKGKGYSRPSQIAFSDEAAATRLLRVKEVLERAKIEGVSVPQDLTDRLADAGKSSGYRSLASTLSLGEELTMLRAKHRIAKQKNPREGFLFGCNTFGHPSRGPDYDRKFKDLFNFGTAHCYLGTNAPTETTRNYTRTDFEVDWLLSMGMKAKPCAIFYILDGVTPQWLKDKSQKEALKFAHEIVYDEVKRYAGKADYCEIVNEAHDKSNACNFSPSELVELAKVCSNAAKEANPNVKRIINCVGLWGESGAKLDKNGNKRRSPYKYMQDCIKAGVEFEIAGLQMYYPRYDLMEIDRALDRYARLGKIIHITEMGCSSSPGIDPSGQWKHPSPGWHGDWSEKTQADWVESAYTLCYSKPYIEAVSWWDLADGSFWPFGGLIYRDFTPKQSYLRLKALFTYWGYK